MTWTFTPPTSDDTPRLEANTRGPAARLFSFFPAHRRGLNLYKYATGAYSQDDPINTSAELSTDVAPTITYYGGHVYTVSDAEAAALTAAGYGANLHALPNTVDANPPPHTFDARGADITAGPR